jgi:hypothetical protein
MLKLFRQQNNLTVTKVQFLNLLLTVGIHIYSSLAPNIKVCCWLNSCPHRTSLANRLLLMYNTACRDSSRPNERIRGYPKYSCSMAGRERGVLLSALVPLCFMCVFYTYIFIYTHTHASPLDSQWTRSRMRINGFLKNHCFRSKFRIGLLKLTSYKHITSAREMYEYLDFGFELCAWYVILNRTLGCSG